MYELIIASATAFWLGFLTSISPCPLATNIAAISFVSRNVGSIPKVLGSGLLYTLGRSLTYAFLGMLLVRGILSAPELSHVLQKYMNLLMGPLLILVAMVLLNLIALPGSGSGWVTKLQEKAERMGLCGAALLGILFALTFCPTSAALFFGSLLPIAVKMESGFLLPSIYGIATGLPVLFFAFLLAFSANRLGKAYSKITVFEKWAKRITGILFLIIGIYFTLTITLHLQG